MSSPKFDKDQSSTALTGAHVAVVGYGPEARERALLLRAAGNRVAIGMRPGGTSWSRAEEDGFLPVPTGIAVNGADVVAVLVPDEDQPSVYYRSVQPHLPAGALVVFERGHAIYTGAIEARGADVVLVTAASTLERTGCRVAVHHDATGKALDRAIAFARAAFGPAATTIGTTTVAEEVEADLAAYEERVGGPEALLRELDVVIVRGAHEPDEAKLVFYERLRGVVARRAAGSGSRPAASNPSSASDVTGVLGGRARMRGVA